MRACIVYLAWAGADPIHLDRFLASYASHSAGADHRLVIAWNGYASAAALAAAQRRTADVPHDDFVVEAPALDLTAYRQVATWANEPVIGFLNSYSRVLSDGWLACLTSALEAPGVALAGTTGSWASHQDYRRYHLHLPSGYGAVFADRERTRQGFLALTRQANPGKRDLGRLPFKLAAAADLVRDRGAFGSFPSPHLRTNAFVVSRRLMVELGSRQIRTKRDAYRLESGRTGFTQQVLDGGHRVVVVDRTGALYDVDAWDRSATFWTGGQENLLVADNRTDDYEQAGADGRRLLSLLAWGTPQRDAPRASHLAFRR
jgi:hypothetical protein